MGIADESRLRLRHTVVREVLPCALIDRVMNRAKKRVRHVPRVPAKRCTVRFYKGCFLPKGRFLYLLCCFKHKACRCRLADARWAVKQKMLGIRRGELRQK